MAHARSSSPFEANLPYLTYAYPQFVSELATCVQEQDEDIKHMETMAIETLDSTSAGLSYLLKMQQEAARTSKRRKQQLAGVFVAFFVLSAWFVYSAAANFDNDDYKGSSGH
jgi:hypothetical protein